MIVRTKPYRLRKRDYIRLASLHLLRREWWIAGLLGIAIPATFFWKGFGWSLLPLSALLLYFGFWLLQFYAVTVLEQNELLFRAIRYEITSRQIMMQFSSKQGMPIEWKQVQHAYVTPQYIVLFLSKAQLIYLPSHILQSPEERKFVRLLLKKKKLLR